MSLFAETCRSMQRILAINILTSVIWSIKIPKVKQATRMTNRKSKRLDVGINVAIVVIAVLILAMAYWKFVASRGSHEAPTSLVGTAIALNGGGMDEIRSQRCYRPFD